MPTPITATNRAADYDWPTLTQILGHETEWPEHWHAIHATYGGRALVNTAFAE